MSSRILIFATLVLAAGVSGVAGAQGGFAAGGAFLPVTDYRLREDLGLLVDEGVINLPQKTWPLARADVLASLQKVRREDLGARALQLVLDRVMSKVRSPGVDEGFRLRGLAVSAGEAPLLRDESTLGRESLEATVTAGRTSDRWSLTLSTTGALSPDDGQHLRLDGSEFSVRLGNWLLGVNQMERWWGPGHGGGLILSTNARPAPGFSLDRVRSDPFDFPILRWLGPWRFSTFVSVLDGDRSDHPHPLFWGMRASFKPVPIVEFGVSRTAMFCGEGRTCNPKIFWNVLTGRDNAGMRVDPEDEPGDQMAGLDLRIVSPFRSLPVALYAEVAGEDSSSTTFPERFLALFGGEGWWLMDSGATIRGRLEYANTKCKWYTSVSNEDCSYRHYIFTSGYRHFSRGIGHTSDADSETWTAQFTYTRASGERWAAVLRSGALDRFGPPDPFNAITTGRSEYDSAELAWDGRLFEQDIGIQVGYERQKGVLGDRSGAFGFVQWRKPL